MMGQFPNELFRPKRVSRGCGSFENARNTLRYSCAFLMSLAPDLRVLFRNVIREQTHFVPFKGTVQHNLPFMICQVILTNKLCPQVTCVLNLAKYRHVSESQYLRTDKASD